MTAVLIFVIALLAIALVDASRDVGLAAVRQAAPVADLPTSARGSAA